MMAPLHVPRRTKSIQIRQKQKLRIRQIDAVSSKHMIFHKKRIGWMVQVSKKKNECGAVPGNMTVLMCSCFILSISLLHKNIEIPCNYLRYHGPCILQLHCVYTLEIISGNVLLLYSTIALPPPTQDMFTMKLHCHRAASRQNDHMERAHIPQRHSQTHPVTPGDAQNSQTHPVTPGDAQH